MYVDHAYFEEKPTGRSISSRNLCGFYRDCYSRIESLHGEHIGDGPDSGGLSPPAKATRAQGGVTLFSDRLAEARRTKTTAS